MRTDDPLDLSKYYAQRGRVLQELGALRDFARLRNRREWQWKRLSGNWDYMKSCGFKTYYAIRAYLRERKYAWQR